MNSAVWTNEFRLATLAAALILCGALPCSAADAPAATASAKTAPQTDTAVASTANASAEAIARWIQELDDDQFSVRQQATRKLSEAGEAAIDPLAIAAVTGSLEVSTRAIAALEANYLRTGEKSHKSAGLAEEALEQIMATANQSAALHAEQVLTFNDGVRQSRAIEKIRELGGVIEYVDDNAREIGRMRATDEPAIAYVAIPKEWKGGDEGLRYVRRLKDLRYLYRIVGSPVSDGALNDLKKSIPDLEIQLRGALLGIEADRTDDECLVKVVKPGSAASKGGIRSGDIIKSFGGKPITDFLSLVELIKETQPGQEVPVVVLRNTGNVTLKVVMGGWSQSKP